MENLKPRRRVVTQQDIEEQIKILTASRDAIVYQIKTLKTFYNYLQVRVWRKQRTNLNAQIRYYEGLLSKYVKRAACVVLLISVLVSCSNKLPKPPNPPKLERNHYKK